MKLWAYGDSHTAGAELGYKVNPQEFRKNGKYAGKNWNHYLIKHNEYAEIISGIACSPEHSWAGQLANFLNVDDYICRARPGWSNDGSIKQMLDDKTKWSKNDVIVWGVATPWRYTPASKTLRADNHQPARFPDKQARVFVEYGPHNDTFKLWTQGLMNLAKTLHPNLYMIQASRDDLTVKDYNLAKPMCITDVSLGDYQMQGKYTVLPDTHYDRPCHKDYAEMIYNILGEKHEQ